MPRSRLNRVASAEVRFARRFVPLVADAFDVLALAVGPAAIAIGILGVVWGYWVGVVGIGVGAAMTAMGIGAVRRWKHK